MPRGLCKLEYRGYDSAGIAVETNDKISIVRRVGKVEELAKAVEDWDVISTWRHRSHALGNARSPDRAERASPLGLLGQDCGRA